jgi:hypothetical protein
MDSEELNKALPPPVTNINDLIGLDFKRNKYGLSLWTDQITYVGYTSHLKSRTTRTIEMFVIGSLSKQWYFFSEIVIVNKKLHWIEEAQMQKREFHESIRNGTYTSKNNTNESN